MKFEKSKLTEMQNWELDAKIQYAQEKIQDFHHHFNGKVYISFSGGKDSTVLLDIARKIYPEIKGVFSDTGLEFPEIREFIKTFNNIEWLKPEMNFKKVIEKWGYPVINKRVSNMVEEIKRDKNSNSSILFLTGKTCNGETAKTLNWVLPEKYYYLLNAPFKISGKCCDVLKKQPFKKFEKINDLKPIVGTMAADSQIRAASYLTNGCNSFNGRAISRPLSIFKDEDIWEYIRSEKIKYCNIYDKGFKNTGCVFCLFGINRDKNRVLNLKNNNYKLYNYCRYKLGFEEVWDYLGIEYGNQGVLEFDENK